MIDLDAIRRKVNQLNGIRNASTVKVFKPKAGEYRIRVLPWKDAKDGSPFHERRVYYGIGKEWIVSPTAWGEVDPISEFISKLFNSGDEADAALAKKLLPKLTTCAAIIDRAAEDEGPQLWPMNKMVAKDALGLFLNAEVGDFTDLGSEGRDLVITVSASGRMFNGRSAMDIKVVPSMKNTPAHADKAKIEKWMGSLPNVDEYFRRKSSAEVKAQFDSWINSGGVEALKSGIQTEGTDRGKDAGSDAVDKLAEELNGSAAAATKSDSKPKTNGKKVVAKKDGKEFNNVSDALDDALNDIEDNV